MSYKRWKIIKKRHSLPPNHLTNIEIPKYCNYEPGFNGAFSKYNLSKIKVGTYFIYVKDKQIQRTHWVSLFTDRNTTG